MKWLTLVLKYLPAVMAGVIGVESALRDQPGATKKDIVLGVIKAGTEAATQVPNADVQGIGQLIDAVVTTLNTNGVFTKGGSAGAA